MLQLVKFGVLLDVAIEEEKHMEKACFNLALSSLHRYWLQRLSLKYNEVFIFMKHM